MTNPNPPPFCDRTEAGQRLVERLGAYIGHPDVLVLGLPRGGVPVAYEVAKALAAPLDIFLVRKLGVPQQPELAMGAIASSGIRYLNPQIIRQFQVGAAEIETITQQEWQELQRRDHHYRQNRPPPVIAGKSIILVDDGIATGATLFVALAALRDYSPQKLIAAIPVAPIDSAQRLRTLADEAICLITPSSFHAVGQWYLDFRQVSDEEVCQLLNQSMSDFS